MSETLRDGLRGVQRRARSTHAGLWFDRYYTIDADRKDDSKRDHLRAVVELGVPAAYEAFYDLWKRSLPEGCVRAIAEVRGRMVVGTGEKGVAEAGITLHHTYGVPFVPGSALKGLVSSFAHLRLEEFAQPKVNRIHESKPGEEHRPAAPYHTLFGAENSAGYVTFFDALYIPNSAKENKPLAPDVITGHHGRYYVGDSPAPPADWDRPTPVPFLTATGRYLIALAGPPEWSAAALEMLGMALNELGIGAKTAAGYGRMRLLPYTEDVAAPSVEVAAQPDPAPPSFEEFTVRLGGVGSGDAAILPLEGRRFPRARYDAQALGRKPAFNEHARIRLYADGSAEVVELL